MFIDVRLLKKAVITSPLISIYGIAPVYLFESIKFKETLISFVGLTLGVFSFWLVNLWLVNKFIQPLHRYLLSFSIVLFLHGIPSMYTFRYVSDGLFFSKFLYVAIATLAVNTVIWMIIESELNKKQKEITEKENNRLKIHNLEAQKRILMQQLQPHFLFNTLSTLKSLIRESPNEAEDYTIKLSGFLRYTIDFASKELIQLHEESAFTADYLALQKKRFDEALQCSINIPEQFMNAELPIFALQALVENAIKHNRITEKNPLKINISVVNQRLKVTNNLQNKAIKSITGTGLSNLNERYLLILGKPIEVVQTDTEFTVYLELKK